MAVDPSYPLYTVACFLCTSLLLLVLATSFIRQSWNLGVAALCFWLFLENLTGFVNSILWADNADVKAEIYCDIVSHIQVFTAVVKPACSLVITRRLSNIASIRSVSMVGMSRKAQRLDRFVDIFLVLILPAIVTSAFYYIVQGARFQVIEGFGCENVLILDGLTIILVLSWSIILPLYSSLFYIPKIFLTFYRLKKETNEFLNTNNSLSRSFYNRILAIGCLDIVVTLPFGITSLAISIRENLNMGSIPFYWGWHFDHTNWGPTSVSYDELSQFNVWAVASQYVQKWIAIVLSLMIFALFGLTPEARETYWSWVIRAIGLVPRSKGSMLSGVVFRSREINGDTEQGSQPYAGSESPPDGSGSHLESSSKHYWPQAHVNARAITSGTSLDDVVRANVARNSG